MDGMNFVAHNVALAYAYGRFDCPHRPARQYVPSIEFADRAVAENVSVGDLPVLYGEMLSEIAKAGA